MAVGGAFGSRSSFSPWDLRGGGGFKSPASLARIRSQAEKVFNDNISSSLFTSPSMQRFKRQTDSLYESATSVFTSITNLTVVEDLRSSLFSWFK